MTSKSALWFGTAFALVVAPFAFAQGEQEELDEETMTSDEGESTEEESYDEELVVIGSQNERARTVLDSPVPVDVLSQEDLHAIGNNADLTDSLRLLLPSYNATVGSATAAFVRPTSLRGMGADELLVLVDGKRRHRGAVIHDAVNAGGRGAHGTNIGMIPAASLEAVELLRDGAGAQYGSDAIAGVLNLRLKSDRSGGELRTQRGYAYKGEPQYRVDGWAGFPLGREGYLTLSGEWLENYAHSRGIQRPEVDPLLQAGITTIAKDSPFNDGMVQTWGRPENKGTRLMVNMAFGLGSATEAYSHASWGAMDGRHRMEYHSPPVLEVNQPGHPTVWQLAQSCWDGIFWLVIFYPDWDVNSIEDCIWATSHEMGFTPFLDGLTRSVAYTTGLRGENDSGFRWDVSFSEGKDSVTYWLFNSRNGSQGVDTVWAARPYQFEFYVGRVRQEEKMANVDFDYGVNDKTFVAFGFQWHREEFSQSEGEQFSFQGTGASGFNGFSPLDEGRWSRDSYAAYVELEYQASDMLFVQAAARLEDFEEFLPSLPDEDVAAFQGADDLHARVDWKLAGRMQVNDDFALRGSVSTGFHAPTTGQSFYSRIITIPGAFSDFPGDNETFAGTWSSFARLLSLGPSDVLRAETSNNLSMGMAGTVMDQWEVTGDFYQINIADRIYKFEVPSVDRTGRERVTGFLTNAFDMTTSGFDVVVSGQTDMIVGREVDLSVAFNYNQVQVENVKQVMDDRRPKLEDDDYNPPRPIDRVLEDIPEEGLPAVTEAQIEDIENAYPNFKMVATARTALNSRYDMTLRMNYFGPHYDENGRIDGVDGNPKSKQLGATVFMDVEITGSFRDKWELTFGLMNLFDIYPDKIEDPYANLLNQGMPYALRSPANFEGGSWYLSGSRKW